MKTEQLTISPPNFQIGEFLIEGTAPLVINKFSNKSKKQIHETQEKGSQSKKGKKRKARNFKADYEGARYRFKDGDDGIPAPAFRNAMIAACRMCGFKMTHAKLSIFCEADGFDIEDGTPLVRITKGTPKYHESAVRNATGVCDLRARPMWNEGWQARIRLRWDADQFGIEDIANLLMRAGMQCGLCEGRPNSRQGCGMGWGLFTIKNRKVA
jgi:hypothetical protein